MNAISFSLYGSNPVYTLGMIRNAELAKFVYPGWQVMVWHDETVPADILDSLRGTGVRLIGNAKEHFPAGMMWRWFVVSEPGVERFLIRDADSRLNFRERRAVDAWIASGKEFHVIRDHPLHDFSMMGGMCGGMALAAGFILAEIKASCPPDNDYATDQKWLAKAVWPKIRDRTLQHDFANHHPRFGGQVTPFPARFGDYRFVGEIFDECDQPNSEHWKQRINYMTP